MLLVPNEIVPKINPIKSYYAVGSKLTLKCSFSYFKSSYIDVKTSVYMEWIHRKTIINITTSSNHDSLQYTIDAFNLSDAGQYNCSYYITSAVPNPNIQPSKKQFHTINISTISKF